HAGGAKAPRDLEARLKNAETETKPNVTAQPETAEPVAAGRQASVSALPNAERPADQGVSTSPENAPPAGVAEPEGGTAANTPQRFYHSDFGEVTESPNQKRIGKGRVGVVAEDGR